VVEWLVRVQCYPEQSKENGSCFREKSGEHTNRTVLKWMIASETNGSSFSLFDMQPYLKAGEGPIVLVLAPTRELAVQIKEECDKVKYWKILLLFVIGYNALSDFATNTLLPLFHSSEDRLILRTPWYTVVSRSTLR